MTDVFPCGPPLANQAVQTIVVNEINAIEQAILYAANAGLIDVIVNNTIMTSNTVGTWSTITGINGTTSTFTLGTNGFTTGNEVILQAISGGTLAAPLLQDVTYYVIPVDANDFKLASNFVNALQSVPITLLNVGTGTQQIELLTASQQYALVWSGQINDRAKRLQLLEVIQYFTDKSYQIYPQLNQVTNYQTLQWVISF